MKRLLLLSLMSVFIFSCSGRKQIERALYAGNYDQAISRALNKLNVNKDRKRKQKFAFLLEESYRKVVARDFQLIEHMKKDNNPENYKVIYRTYINMNARQEAIKPVLPLRIGNRMIRIKFYDFSDEIIKYEDKFSSYEYGKALGLMNTGSKFDAREAYAILQSIEQVNPNYRDVRNSMNQAYEKGLDYVVVDISNQTGQIIPQQLENELLAFDTYGLNNFWTVYHGQPIDSVAYDFSMKLELQQINISPEQFYERQHLRQRQIVDGWEYQLDEYGNVMQDSLGNDIKIDRIINVRARVFESEQLKSAQVLARVTYTDMNNQQLLDSFNINSEFVFQNRFGRFRGDERALSDYDRQLISQGPIPFPTNNQMVFDAGTDVKNQLKSIINTYAFSG